MAATPIKRFFREHLQHTSTQHLPLADSRSHIPPWLSYCPEQIATPLLSDQTVGGHVSLEPRDGLNPQADVFPFKCLLRPALGQHSLPKPRCPCPSQQFLCWAQHRGTHAGTQMHEFYSCFHILHHLPLASPSHIHGFPRHLCSPCSSNRSFSGDRWNHARHLGGTVRGHPMWLLPCVGGEGRWLQVSGQSSCLISQWCPLPTCRLQQDLDVSTIHLLQPSAGGFLCTQVGWKTDFLLYEGGPEETRNLFIKIVCLCLHT